MGKRKSAAKPVPESSSRASVLPKPQLIGEERPSQAPALESSDAKAAPTAKHEPTLKGIAKQAPSALPPLKAAATSAGERPAAEKRKDDSSLVGLSLQVGRSSSRRSGSITPPAAPPSTRPPPMDDSEKPFANEPTDYDVDVIDSKVLNQKKASASAVKTSKVNVWEAHDTPGFRRSKRGTILAAVAVFSMAAVGLGVCAYASNGTPTEAATSAARSDGAPANPPTKLGAVGAAKQTPAVAAAKSSETPSDTKKTAALGAEKTEPEAAQKAQPVPEAKTSANASASSSSATKAKAKLSARQKARQKRRRADRRKAKRK